ncbi:phage virion morphogenesis protein [Shinella sp. CPCC 100929]|uniref:Phage virion morphogenesis protein n=1 Tax=Shinella lacus TaxID=2654216 RepID=A0ABT1R791_9HYPH|nr:phage virion morphogenesis protein [Shinella lacus]MCQ4630934.1 phage virion morphogenesis protein [Shinella lacus]
MAVRIVASGLEEAAKVIAQIADPDVPQYLDELGGIVTSQTQKRIRSEKTSPAGEAWKPNREGTSILFRSGALDDSIHHEVAGNSVEVGSNLVYAGIHQHGGKIVPKNKNALAFSSGGQFFMAKSVTMPARPYVGISAANEPEIIAFTEAFISAGAGDAR